MRSFYLVLCVFVCVAFARTTETKTAAIASYKNNAAVFYDKAVFTERLVTEIKENIKISAPGRKEKIIIHNLVFDTLEIKKIKDVNYVYAFGKTGLADRPFFISYIALTQKGDELVIVSKNNKNIFAACPVFPKFVLYEQEKKRSPYLLGNFEYEDWTMEEKHAHMSTSRFSENGLGLYFK